MHRLIRYWTDTRGRRSGVGGRVGAFAANLAALYGRGGMGGLMELLLARAAPEMASYRRVTIIALPMHGHLHQELAPRRVYDSNPEVEEFHARLSGTREPGVPIVGRDRLRSRLAAGCELWAFRLDGRIAHLRWVVADALRFDRFTLPLQEGERAVEGALTPVELRGRGLASAAREHVCAFYGAQGTHTMLTAIAGVNRRFLASTLQIEGARRLATVHAVSVDRRQWFRAAPDSQIDAALLEKRGLPTGRWLPLARAAAARHLPRPVAIDAAPVEPERVE